MKNVYYNNFRKYANLIKEYDGDYAGLIEEVEKVLVPKQESDDRKAVVMFGFSGNGKSTWIREFCKDRDDFRVLSMDEVGKGLSESLGRPISGWELTGAFSNKLDEMAGSGVNLVIDGNFLNLLTRSALTDALHTYGYEVSLMDLTPIFGVTIQSRIRDEASKTLGVEVTEDNVWRYENHPMYLKMKKRVMDYHQLERERSAFDEQMLLGATSIGVERVMLPDNGQKQGTESKKL